MSVDVEAETPPPRVTATVEAPPARAGADVTATPPRVTATVETPAADADVNVSLPPLPLP